ncbi:FAD-dependent oxidoreductase [Mahella australiensis]|uniref:Pyridine nucleotide-disulfide oxidoreductase n=1 Tax=Mahella australiensis (strain DSM 15567 / CIP 107919 / 50-1 BON) TaxID=697281 RepID=F4A124_MAHA5|nr:FAD-dependent oxidoreductase [Mahella australiensis]AEE95927.1 pyridine nucleotide-disulfide oxidoreductase [Mahella australiensis 50-1 BON]
MKDKNTIEYVSGSQQGSEKRFDFYGTYFLDDTGDATVGYLAGADYRMGRESKDEFGERIAPDVADPYVIPSTLTFYAKDVGKPVKYIRPDFAIDLFKTDVLNYRTIPKDKFWRFQWYYEVGVGADPIGDSETITQKHRALVYGIWDYIKNSGEYDAENYDLEYVACIPGKRESRRLMGDYILKERDIVAQTDFDDTVGHGGWSIDLHAIEGFFSKELVNKHFYLKGIYQIPYRTGYSRNVDNLFMAGRCMSATHVAFGSTRVMATLSTLGQALGAAAYLCKKYDVMPRDVSQHHVKELQQLLLKHDQYIVGCKNEDEDDKARNAKIKTSSIKQCRLLEIADGMIPEDNIAMLIPVKARVEDVSLSVKAFKDTCLRYTVYVPSKKENYYPETKITEGQIDISASDDYRWIKLPVNQDVGGKIIFLEIEANRDIELGISDEKLPGVVCMRKNENRAQTLCDIETLEKKDFMWHNLNAQLCFDIFPTQGVYEPENINNGYARPYGLPNLWLSDGKVDGEYVSINFDNVKNIHEIVLYFDSDFNQRLGYEPKDFDVMPTVIKDYDVYYKEGEAYNKLVEVRNNYQRVNRIEFDPIETDEVKIVFRATNGSLNAGLFEARVY